MVIIRAAFVVNFVDFAALSVPGVTSVIGRNPGTVKEDHAAAGGGGSRQGSVDGTGYGKLAHRYGVPVAAKAGPLDDALDSLGYGSGAGSQEIKTSVAGC